MPSDTPNVTSTALADEMSDQRIMKHIALTIGVMMCIAVAIVTAANIIA